MADYLNNVLASDIYTDALTLGPDFTARSLAVTISDSAALMQLATGALGNWRWLEREFFAVAGPSNGQSFRINRVIGVRFRNAVAGKVARVIATLSGDDDPDFEVGFVFPGSIGSGGSITPGGGGVLTGQVDATGAPIAGTGWTSLRNGLGTYTVTFATPYTSPPTVALTLTSFGIGFVAPQSAGSFRVNTFSPGGGASADQSFEFLVNPTA